MARTQTAYDIFSAIGEPKPGALIEQLVIKPMTVNELVEAMKWPQPAVSKHLGVLKEVRIVAEKKSGRFWPVSNTGRRIAPDSTMGASI